jgi:hypothetical protein
MGGCGKCKIDKVFVSKSKGKRLIERQRRKLDDNIKLDRKMRWVVHISGLG